MLERYIELPVKGKYYLEYHLDPLTNLNLTVESCGILHAPPGDSRELLRPSISIYFVLNGKGKLQIQDTVYNLEKGQGFFVPPDARVKYSASHQDPWSISWIYLHGTDAELYLNYANLTAEKMVFSYAENDFLFECVSQMMGINTIQGGQQLRLLGILNIFLSELIKINTIQLTNQNDDLKKGYAKKVVLYITDHYSKNISIEVMSQHIGLDRRYLGTIFKSYFKTSLKGFLTDFRVNKACELMPNSHLTLKSIASMVGYHDSLAFSKIFKKIKGISPKDYRNSLISLTPQALPEGWKTSDVGNTIIQGSTSYDNGSYTLHGTGWDIWGDYDENHFAYVEMSGNCTIIARVSSIQNTHEWSKAGLMIRETLENYSKHAFVLITPSNGICFQWRSANNAFAECTNQRNLYVPEYLKLVRSRNSFTGYYSSDGSNWVESGTKLISMDSTIYVGLAVTSHIVGISCKATFDNVNIIKQ